MRPCASEPTVTRNNSALAARLRHPTQVRTGPGHAGEMCSRATDDNPTPPGAQLRTRAPPRWITGRSLRGRVLVRADVDPPAGETGREAGVLALLADRERELEVGD